MNRPVSAELALAIACCRWPRSPIGDAAVRAAGSVGIDWELFAGVVARNRISALAKDALQRAGVEHPSEVATKLAQAQIMGAYNGLALARESIRLQRTFDEAGVPALIIKGAPIAMLAYRDLGRKESWDIDLLTELGSAIAARRALEKLGFALTDPAGLDDRQFERFLPHSKEAAFYNPMSGITIELHWRLVDNEQLLAGVGLTSEVQTVSLGGGSVQTLGDAPLFAYLCVHGATHNWSRLKWLADVGAFLANRGPTEVEGLYRAACCFGAERPARLVLVLCHRMLGLRLDAALEAELRADIVVRHLSQNVLAGLQYGSGILEHLAYTQAWWRARIGRLFLGRNVVYVVRELQILWTAPEDRARVALPRSLSFLYHLLRIPSWLFRKSGRYVRRWRAR